MRRFIALAIVFALAWQSLPVLRAALHAVHDDLAHAALHEIGLGHEHGEDGTTAVAFTFDAAAHVASDLPAPVMVADLPAPLSAWPPASANPLGPPTSPWSQSALDGPMRPPIFAA